MIRTPSSAATGPATDDEELPAMEQDSLSRAVERYERHLILRTLAATADNKAEAARRLGISERNLWYKLKKHGL